mmetsp:Transcript_53130/g.161403  ORF Transcript_53130/g.161403 Transcript_53130/m.161403 type:complete len:276 (-) Transcript_53130:561-1388(-)
MAAMSGADWGGYFPTLDLRPMAHLVQPNGNAVTPAASPQAPHFGAPGPYGVHCPSDATRQVAAAWQHVLLVMFPHSASKKHVSASPACGNANERARTWRSYNACKTLVAMMRSPRQLRCPGCAVWNMSMPSGMRKSTKAVLGSSWTPSLILPFIAATLARASGTTRGPDASGRKASTSTKAEGLTLCTARISLRTSSTVMSTIVSESNFVELKQLYPEYCCLKSLIQCDNRTTSACLASSATAAGRTLWCASSLSGLHPQPLKQLTAWPAMVRKG